MSLVSKPIETFENLCGTKADSLAAFNFTRINNELDLLGEVINLAGNYKRGVKVSKIENLHPEHLSQIELDISKQNNCEQTSFLHIGRACFQRISIAEAQFAREDRASEFEKISALRIVGTQNRPLLSDAIILPGLSSQKLAFNVAVEAGIPVGEVEVTDFANTEMKVSINTSVRGKRVFIVQSIGYDSPRHILALKLTMNAAVLAGADEINLVLPSFAFARQDRKPSHLRAPISAEVIAADLVNEGMTRLITLEIHAQQIVGFFRKKPVDNLLAIPLSTCEAIRNHKHENLVIAYPDQGMAKRAKDDGHSKIITAQIGHSVPTIEMRKDRPEDNVVAAIEILGDAKVLIGSTVLLLDDMIDTGGTTIECASALKRAGAAKVIAVAAHGVFSLNAVEKLKTATVEFQGINVPVLDEVYITDSLPIYKSCRNVSTGAKKIHAVSCAPLVGEAVRRVAEKNGDSLRELYEQQTFYKP